MALALSAMPVVIHADDWIGRIAGNAYITQLSIPGAHDAGTGYGFTGFYGTIAGPSMALTQDLTIEGMWDCGVRAFDLRPAMSSGELQIFHGVCQTKLSFASAINRLCDLLDAHPSEFAVVLMRHETDGDSNNSGWAGEVSHILSNSRYSAHLVPFRPDMTVESARGKIILMTRDAFDTPAAAQISGWSHSQEFENQQRGSITCGGATASLYVQDFYDCTASDGAALKTQAITRMLDYSSTLHLPSAPNGRWVINHTSGYTKSASSDGNRNLAAVANKAMIDYLSSSSNTPGPTGIVLMDFAGADKSGSYDVKGLELTSSLVNHNFRYQMRTAGPDDTILEPTPSTETIDYWHTFTTPLREYRSVAVTDNGALVGNSNHSDRLNHWKLTERTDGTFDIINRSTGAYINPKSANSNDQLHTSAIPPMTGWKIEPADTDGYYVIYSGKDVQLHQTESGYDYKIFNWGNWGTPDKSDAGCQFEIRVVDSNPSDAVMRPYMTDAVTTYWHTISAPQRENRIMTLGDDMMLNGDSEASGPKSQWMMTTRPDGDVNIINRHTKAYIDPKSSYNSQMRTTASEPSAGWKLDTTGSDNLYVIYSGSSTQLNQTMEVFNYQIFNWGNSGGAPETNDSGCLFHIHMVDSEPTSSNITDIITEPYDSSSIYDIQGRRLQRATAPGIYIIGGKKHFIRP